MVLVSKLLQMATTSLIQLALGLMSQKVLGTTIVLALDKVVKKTSWEWDDKLLDKIREEWKV